MSKKNNPWANSRIRNVVGSNGTLQSVLSVPIPRGETKNLRKAISASARATKAEVAEGRNAMFTIPVPAAKGLRDAVAYSGSYGLERAFWPDDDVIRLAQEAHHVLNTFDPGSVGRMIINMHCLGFRLFQKASLAGSYLAADTIKHFDDDLQRDISTSNLNLPGISIPAIYNALSTSFRGKGEETSVEPIVIRFFSAFTGRPLVDKELQTPEYAFCKKIAEKLAGEYKTWSEMTQLPASAGKVISPVFHAHGFSVNIAAALDTLDSMLEIDGDLKFRTVAHDRAAPVFALDLPPATALIAIAARYAREAQTLGVKPTNYVKECVTTTNANGLGWLLNKGISYLPVATDSDLKKAIGADRSSPAINLLISELTQIKTPKLFSNFTLADVRSDVQGKIDSFLSNHLARLEVSCNALDSIAPSMQDWIDIVIENTRLITSFEAYNTDLLVNSSDAVSNMKSAAKYLLGMSSEPIENDRVLNAIESFSHGQSVLDYAVGATNTINSIKKRNGDTHLIEMPDALSDISSLPRLSQSITDPTLDLEYCRNELALLANELAETIENLTSKYDLTYEKSLLVRSESFKGQLAAIGKHRSINSDTEFAYRDFLARLSRLAFRGSSHLRELCISELWSSGIFLDELELNEHINNRQHYIFVNPNDTKPKKLLRLSDKRPSICDIIQNLVNSCEGRDKHLLTMLNCNILLAGLPDNINSSLLKASTLQRYGDRRFVFEITSREISRVAAQALISSAYTSRISGLLYKLNKTTFSHTYTFKPYINSRLHYVPKVREWKVPAQLFEGRFADILGSDLILWASNGIMNVVDSAKRISRDKSFDTPIKLALLKEMPHSYAMAADISGMGIKAQAIVISPAGIEQAKEISGLIMVSLPRNNTPAIRAIDGWMRGGKVSPPMLQIQTVYQVINGITQEDCEQRSVLFQMPVTEITDVQPVSAHERPVHLLGIDPGEYGFGIALTDLNGRMIDSGFVHINSLIGFLKSKREHREVTTPRQQYKARYSNHMEKAARAAAGDIAHILDRLIHAFNAIPVFEVQGNDAADSDAVWERIMYLYSFSENDAQNTARISHWFGAGLWDHPTITRKLPTEKKAKAFIGFPGTRVGSAGNSQRCSCCGKNPIESVRDLLTNKGKAEIKGGQLVTPNGIISLSNPDPVTAADRRRTGLGPEWIVVGNKTFVGGPNTKEGKELLTIIRRSIRRAPDHRKTTQGIESIYVCAFDDCASFNAELSSNMPINAEANAAINICKKLADQLVIND